MFLGVRFQQDGETEVACSLALLKDLCKKLGPRFIDILVADALYLQAPFVAEMESLALDWVINLKDNQPDLLAEAERFTAGPPSRHETTAQQDLQLWHVPEMDWPGHFDRASWAARGGEYTQVRRSQRSKGCP